MDADDFRDYMLSFLFLRYLSDNYETAAKKELGGTTRCEKTTRKVPLALWYANNVDDIPAFEKQMRRKVHYVIQPAHLWNSIANLARTQNSALLMTLQEGFKYIQKSPSESTFDGLFSQIDLSAPRSSARPTPTATPSSAPSSRRSPKDWQISPRTSTRWATPTNTDRSVCRRVGQEGGRVLHPAADFRHPPAIVTLDSQEPKTGTKKRLESVMDLPAAPARCC